MIKVLTVGMLQEHAYFFINDKTKHGFLIDPGAEAEKILSVIREKQFVIEKILLTHGHFDHIGAVQKIRETLGCPVIIHEEGKQYLQDASWNLSNLYEEGYTLSADEYLIHGDTLSLEDDEEMVLQVIHVPGHTSDGAAYYSAQAGVAFVGDTIFNGAVGRCDHPGGNMNRLLASIKAQIFTLPDSTVLFPGHGPSTTVQHEKASNPYFNLYE